MHILYKTSKDWWNLMKKNYVNVCNLIKMKMYIWAVFSLLTSMHQSICLVNKEILLVVINIKGLCESLTNIVQLSAIIPIHPSSRKGRGAHYDLGLCLVISGKMENN